MDGTDERAALAAELQRHVAEEDEILQEYRLLSDELAEGSLSILVDHIVTDEEMHHLLFRTLAEWLEAPPVQEQSLSAQGLDRDLVLQHTQRLKEHEARTIESCREMVEQLSGDGNALFEGVLDAIIHDSEKHHRLLTLVEELID
jgi:hypothetical protein